MKRKWKVSLEGYALDLTKIEFDILLLLLSNQGKVFSREVIFNAINGIGYNSKDRTVDMHISNLRAKIGDDPKNPKYIKSVWGIGFQNGRLKCPFLRSSFYFLSSASH